MNPATEPLPDWANSLPEWVRDDEIRWLANRPWLSGFIRPDDYSLDPAIERFEASQRRMKSDLRAAGYTNTDARELVDARGHETTALRSAVTASPGVIRHVRIDTPDADRIEGIAVPYGQRSWPVIVRGVCCYEMFDARSFAPLPPSCPLIDSHNYELPRVGRVTTIRQTRQGLVIEASINETNRMTWIHRWARCEHSSLSIAFASAPILDNWTNWNGYPLRTVRGAQLIDVAVVQDPAYPAARITTTTTRKERKP